MAKTPVTMKVDGYKDREVMMVSYDFEQETDVEGQMSGIPRGGKITVRVKALNDGTPDLLAWMTERNLPKNGSIEFLETKTGKAMKTIKFTNGYCVDFQERWEDKVGHFEEIVITCKNIEVGSVKFENEWAAATPIHWIRLGISCKNKKQRTAAMPPEELQMGLDTESSM